MSLSALMSSFTGAGGVAAGAAGLNPLNAVAGLAGTPNTSASGLTAKNRNESGGVTVGGLSFGNTGGQDWIKY